MISLIKDLEVNDGTLVIPADMEQIPEGVCAGRDDIRRVIIPQTVYSIGPEAFSECPALEEVIFPDSFLHISAAAFLNCASLSRVILSKNLQSINEGAFLGCAALKQLALPQTLEFIGEMAFWCSGLEEITVPERVKVISENAFWDCAGLLRADVLGAATRIENNAFGNCPFLTEGFIAPGYPEDNSPPAQLLYTLLWCSCPERHAAATISRAREFVRQKETLVMERILKSGNVPALTGIVSQGLLDPAHIDGYIRECAQVGNTELTALLLQAKPAACSLEEEFDL